MYNRVINYTTFDIYVNFHIIRKSDLKIVKAVNLFGSNKHKHSFLEFIPTRYINDDYYGQIIYGCSEKNEFPLTLMLDNHLIGTTLSILNYVDIDVNMLRFNNGELIHIVGNKENYYNFKLTKKAYTFNIYPFAITRRNSI